MSPHRLASRLVFGLFVAAVAIGGGCAVGPNFKHPAPPAAQAYTAHPLAAAGGPEADSDAQRFVEGLDIPGQWWSLFQSPALNALVEASLKANPDVAAAQAALLQAHEMTVAQRGAYLPSVSASFQPTRQQLAGNQSSSAPGIQGNGANLSNSTNPSGPPPYTEPLIYNFYTVQVAVSYSPDVFGLNRRMVESAKAQEEQQRFALEATVLTLTSNVVGAAIQEASLRAQIASTERIIAANRKLLDELRLQLSSGYTNSLAVLVQESQLAQEVATLPPLRKQLEQNRDLLARLSGVSPGSDPAETFELSTLQLPRELPLSLPSKLVEQRPDVRQAEENLHYASAQVGVAVANRLPEFDIDAAYGGAASQISQLFAEGGPFWTLMGEVTQPIFAGGALSARQKAAEQGLEQARAQYRGTVLTALQNVADALHALDEDARELKAARDADSAARVTLDMTGRQLKAGYTNTPALLAAEQAYQQAEIALVQAEAAQYDDTAALFAALGGGWWNRADSAGD